MLKLQAYSITVPVTFEDFLLTVYVLIDDLCRCFAPPEVSGGRHASDAKLSDPEIIAIAIYGELAGVDSERAWHSFVKRNYRKTNWPKPARQLLFKPRRRIETVFSQLSGQLVAPHVF